MRAERFLDLHREDKAKTRASQIDSKAVLAHLG